MAEEANKLWSDVEYPIAPNRESQKDLHKSITQIRARIYSIEIIFESLFEELGVKTQTEISSEIQALYDRVYLELSLKEINALDKAFGGDIQGR